MNPPRLSILIPSRGRPGMLRNCVESVLTSERLVPPGIEIVVGLDHDEQIPPWLSWLSSHDPELHVLHRPIQRGLAAKVNMLAHAARGAALVAVPNDVVITAPQWTNRAIEALDANPKPTVFYAPIGDDCGFTHLPILRQRDLSLAGVPLTSPWYPSWFTDSWWNEVGDMVGRKVCVDLGVRLQPIRHGSQGLREVKFWARFFDATREERKKAARALLGGTDPLPLSKKENDHILADDYPSENYEAHAETIPQPDYHSLKAEASLHLATLTGKRP